MPQRGIMITLHPWLHIVFTGMPTFHWRTRGLACRTTMCTSHRRPWLMPKNYNTGLKKPNPWCWESHTSWWSVSMSYDKVQSHLPHSLILKYSGKWNPPIGCGWPLPSPQSWLNPPHPVVRITELKWEVQDQWAAWDAWNLWPQPPRRTHWPDQVEPHIKVPGLSCQHPNWDLGILPMSYKEANHPKPHWDRGKNRPPLYWWDPPW